MARVCFAVLLIGATLGQTVLLPAATPFSVLPNPVLVLLLAWVTLRGIAEGLIWVFAAGLLLDALALDRLGTNALALLPVIAAGAAARRRVFQSAVIVPVVLTVVATIGHGVILALVRELTTGNGLPAILTVIRLTFVQSLLNAILMPPLYWLAARISAIAPERA